MLSNSGEQRPPSGASKTQTGSEGKTRNPMLQDEDDIDAGVAGGPVHIANPMLAQLNDAKHTPTKKTGKNKASKKKNQKREKTKKKQEGNVVANPMFEGSSE